MRRILLSLAGLAAVSCATAPKPEAVKAPVEARPLVLPGFERQQGEILTEYDLTHDGKPDVWKYTLKDASGKEILLRKELAFGFDGVPRSWNFYEKGKLVRKERDTNGDGNVDYWEYWENGEVDRIGVYVEGDGQVDRWEARKSAEAAKGEGQ